MSYESYIAEQRSRREELIKKFQEEASEESTEFKFFPVDKKWQVPAEVNLRKPKEGMPDYKLQFNRVGKISFELDGNPHTFNLYQVTDEETPDYYIYIKDGTSGNTSYGVGRFVQVVKDGENYSVDFNLAYTPVCGHISATACPWARESSPVLIEAGEMASKES